MATAEIFEIEAIEKDVVARQIKKGSKKIRRSKVDLASAITDIGITDTTKGSSTIEITIKDLEFELLESAFFDPDEDGKLEPIEIRFPDEKVRGKEFWWRMTMLGFNADGQLVLTFMERAAAKLMAKKGPVKAKRRSKTTRSEFIYGLVKTVKNPELDYHSRELHRKQPIAKESKSEKKSREKREKDKDGGINRDERLSIRNGPASPSQLRMAERHLDVGADLGAPRAAMLGVLMVGINETGFVNKPFSSDGLSKGVLQLRTDIAEPNHIDNMDVEAVARFYFNHGSALNMGAIEYARKNPNASPAEINQKTWGGTGFPLSTWTQWADEAKALLEAYGGGNFSSGGTKFKQYNFDIGTSDNPHETYWDGINRLAEEVNWSFFVDGDDVYYDSEMSLIQQKPIAVIKRGEASVIDWSFDWDTRKIATEFTLDLICNPFAFRAGQVFKLEDFGPASAGSTAQLPGRWLIKEISRPRYSLSSTFTLAQPTKPNPEPRPEQAESGSSSGAGGSGDLESLIARCEIIARYTPGYDYGGGHGPPLKDLKATQGLDCSSSCSLALFRADMFPADVSWVSGTFASQYGKPGKGKEFTVWANDGHVWIEFHKGKYRRFDTSCGPSGPHLCTGARSTAGFTPRHWPGM